jgi:NAD(P)-dependent dehydrogenase (short-subunit alcohol dehydrogenase family)
MKLTNASALVTGGAGGFGGATARRLAAMGARVVIADVADERGQALAKELGGGAVYVHCDIMDEGSIANAVQTAADIGPLRAAVVVHGGPPPPAGGRVVGKDGKRLPLVAFTHTVQVYLSSAFAVTSYAAAAMSTSEPVDANGQRGVIINTASIAGFEGQPGLVPYSAAKAGIIGMTLTLARDLSPAGVRAMAIAPGTFLTLAYGGMTAEEGNARFAQGIPFPKRMGEPDEYAILAAHIVENDYLNGTTIRLDAGQRFQ